MLINNFTFYMNNKFSGSLNKILKAEDWHNSTLVAYPVLAIFWLVIFWNYTFSKQVLKILAVIKDNINDAELSFLEEERAFSSMMVRGISGCCHLTLTFPFLACLLSFIQPVSPLMFASHRELIVTGSALSVSPYNFSRLEV